MSKSSTEAGAKAMAAARRSESVTKRQEAISVTEGMLASGVAVTFSKVARAARVSRWFAYNDPAVRERIEDAIEEQKRTGVAVQKTSSRQLASVSPASLRADLLMAREEIKALREDNTKMKTRLERTLGAEVEAASQAEHVERIRELERFVVQLQGDLQDERARVAELEAQNEELQEDVTAQREALRRMMREQSSAG